MIKYTDKGTARQHLTDRLMESALNNVGIRSDVDAVFLDIAKNRLPVWMDELQTYDVAEVQHGKWIEEDDAVIHGHCSICGWNAIWQETDVFGMPYCPNCGAKMDSE